MIGNSASYGNNIASFPVKIEYVDDTNPITIDEVASG